MNKKKISVFLLATILIIVSLSGCSSLTGKSDIEKLEADIEDLESQLEELEDTVKELEKSMQATSDEKNEASNESKDASIENDSEDNEPDTSDDDTTASNESEFSKSEVLESLDITEYPLLGEYSNYVLLVIKNNSEFDITIYGEIIFKNEEDKIIGTESEEKWAVGPNQEVVLSFYSEDVFDSYEYTLSASPEKYYESIVSSLSKEVSVTDSKAIIAITNDGDKAAQYVEFTVLFLKDGVLVDHSWGYCMDDDSEIKPGKTNYDESKSYEEFDSVLVYLSARSAME